MIFSYLKLNDFLIYYGENTLDFPDPDQDSSMTIVLASNNSGKTTFIKALRFLLYGEHQGSDLRGLINHRALNSGGAGSKKASVEAKVRLTENEPAQTIRRTITVKKNSDGSFGRPSEIFGRIMHEPRGDKFDQDDNGSLQRKLEMKVPKALFDAYYFHGEPLAGQAARPGQVGGVKAALETLLHEDRWKAARDLVERAQTRLNRKLSELAGHGEVFRILRLQPNPQQATELLQSAWISPDVATIEMLMEAGGDPNQCDGIGRSLLHHLIVSFGWSCDRCFSHRDPRQDVEKIAWLIRRGGKWNPSHGGRDLDSLRRSFYRDSGELAVEVIRLLDAGNACSKDLLRDFINKPKMRGWVKKREPELFERLMGV